MMHSRPLTSQWERHFSGCSPERAFAVIALDVPSTSGRDCCQKGRAKFQMRLAMQAAPLQFPMEKPSHLEYPPGAILRRDREEGRGIEFRGRRETDMCRAKAKKIVDGSF